MRLRIVTLILVAVVTACGGGNEVGSEGLLNFDDEVNQRLGEATPTPTPAEVDDGPKEKQSLTNPDPTPRRQAVLVDVAIQSDAAGTAFDPPVVQITLGSVVRWTNADSKERSVEADDGTFSSGLLAPGASFTYESTTVGKFNYHDGTRPYAVASLEVRE